MEKSRYTQDKHSRRFFRRPERTMTVEEYLNDKAYRFRIAEGKYYNGLKRLTQTNPISQVIFDETSYLLHVGYYEYSRKLTVSTAQRKMKRLLDTYGFVIGGADGHQSILSRHTYDPEVHTDILYDEDFEMPVEGCEILVAGSEIGYMRGEEYRQILPAVYGLPNPFGDLDADLYRKVLLKAREGLTQIVRQSITES